VHRDLKPENFMFVHFDTEENMAIKLIDFGLAKNYLLDKNMLHTKTGTPY